MQRWAAVVLPLGGWAAAVQLAAAKVADAGSVDSEAAAAAATMQTCTTHLLSLLS